MKNAEIAGIFFEMADLLEMQDIKWKPWAYRKAALTIQSLSQDIADVWKQGKLTELPGVGEKLAEKIVEFIQTGKVKEHERLKKSFPVDVEALGKIPGLGPKTIKLLYEELKIRNLKDLEKAARLHQVRRIKHLGGKTEENIMDGLALVKQLTEGRMLLGFALITANELVNELGKSREIKELSPAGSLRRRKETIGDLDLLAVSSEPLKTMNAFASLKGTKQVIVKGKTKSMIRLENNFEVDLRVVEEKNFGAALQYFTGNKSHNIKLRTLAIKKGWKLNEYGLFDKAGKQIAGRTEKEIYSLLGMDFIEPEMREDRGEIEAALEHRLPKLIRYSEVKGDLHCHTVASDGSNSLEEVVMKAKQLGHEFIGISDHTKKLAVARGLDEKQIMQHKKAIDKLNEKENGIEILMGLEANIDRNGGIDVSNKVLKEMDYVIASIHWGMKMGEKEMTARICNAMDNEFVTIIGHPTGRKIHETEAYKLDLDKVFEKASATSTLLEINAYPVRLDLNDELIMKAKDFGCRFSIGSDSHSLDQMNYYSLGASLARRGWLEKRQVINSNGGKEIRKALKE